MPFRAATVPSGAVRLDDVLDGPSADGAAGIDLPLQLQAALVTQAHVAAGVDNCVHLLVKAHSALATLAASATRGSLWGQEGWRDRGAQGGARSCD